MASDNKYDRQLRLWGANGQKALMESRILLLGCHPSGVETLKNLVLPGVGFVAIVDDRFVNQRDLGNNFFVSKNDLGQKIAEVVTKNLLEMNPDVSGEAISESPENFVKNKAGELSKFNFIISSEQTLATNLLISDLADAHSIKCAFINTNGLIGKLRLYGLNHTIIESKPSDVEIDDLRLDAPFKELQDYVNTFQLETLNDMSHRHVPYVVLLIQFLKLWKDQHEGKVPSTADEKKEFKFFVQKKSRNYGEEENFQNAVNNSFKCFRSSSQLSFELRAILESEHCTNATRTSDPFWILAKTLKSFHETEGFLPLLGTLPDMTSLTEYYVPLKEIYKEKGLKDAREMRNHMQKIFGEGTQNIVSDELLKTFCENVKSLEWVRYRSLRQETNTPLELSYFENDCHKWYFALRGRDIFKERFGREPGTQNADDAKVLQKIVNVEILGVHFQSILPIELEVFSEICRYEGSLLHNISAIIGGVASQEAIKLLTKQFVPLNNTFIFNGITTEGAVFEF